MSQEKLEEGVRIFFEQMKARLVGLSSTEKQQYLEGLFHVLDAVTRFCNPDEITPFEREQFIGSLKSWVYSETIHLGLDDSRMKPLVDTDSVSVTKSLEFAAKVQVGFLGIPLDSRQKMRLLDMASMAEIEAARNS